MKQSLSLKMGQSLAMTPALQQAIRLLQLSTLDLQTEIQTALDENLMLERVEDGETAEDDGEATSAEAEESSLSATQTEVEAQPLDEAFLPEEWSEGESQWRDSESEAERYEYQQASLHTDGDLYEHLAWQTNLSFSDPVEAEIAANIIDAVNEDGYLEDWPALRARLGSLPEASDALVLAVLRRVQTMDPAGVAARDLAECLDLQLAQIDPPDATSNLARTIVREHLDVLGQRDTARISRLTQTDEEAVADAVALIRTLSPHPGRAYSAKPPEYVVPDVIVLRRDDRWMVSLNPETAPRIRINRQYAGMIRRSDASGQQQTLRQHLQEARYLLNALKSRNETLLRVATRIVEEQRAFLDYGNEAMRPLVLRDVAENLGIHESTVSRATANKFMLTPRGLYELKYFFSSSVRTTQGGTASATAIQAMLKRLVSAEPAQRPHSDARLSDLLREEGIEVARRTIAKYRESMGIPPAHERRRMA
jgi:RNA polymerase sigma-54 factor